MVIGFLIKTLDEKYLIGSGVAFVGSSLVKDFLFREPKTLITVLDNFLS